jgi:hypothetical protein
MTVTHENYFESRLNSENASYHSVQNLLSSLLVLQNLNIKIYRALILPVVMYGCEGWPVKVNEMGRTSNTNGKEKKYTYKLFVGKNLEKRDNL